MTLAAPLAVHLTVDELRALIREELARLHGASGHVLVPYPEAARRLGVSLRSVQRRARDGTLPVERIGGIPHVRLPAALATG